MQKELLEILVCPLCIGNLKEKSSSLFCATCKQNYPIIKGIPVFTNTITESQTKLSLHKFQELYKEGTYSDEELSAFGKKKFEEFFPMRNYLQRLPSKKNGKYLELGIGGSIAIDTLATKGYAIYGIDFSMTALRLTVQMAETLNIPCYLVCADIAKPPFKSDTFDIIYGGGTIEHVEDTQTILKQSYRILKKEGYCINTVPVVSISSLTYRQLSGNIPEIPILKQLVYITHRYLLKTKFMFTGYEKSFLPSTIKKMHKKAGFKNIQVVRYEFTPQLPYIPSLLKPALQRLEKFRPFWTAINVIARK